MFYNCENLLFSQGHTYEKLTNLSRVIVAAGEGEPPAIIGLAEVENDSILTRWTKHTPLARWHYEYLISHSSDERGINVALLYQKEEFRLLGHEFVRVTLPKNFRPTRDLLHAWGRIVNGDTLDVVVVHLPSRYNGKKTSDRARKIAHEKLKMLMDSVCSIRSKPHLIVMGDFNDYPTSSSIKEDFSDYVNLMFPLQKDLWKNPDKLGSHKHQGEWGFLDQFFVNKELLEEKELEDSTIYKKDSTIYNNVRAKNPRSFALPFMLIKDKKYLGLRPKRSRYGSVYEGGYSDHLPILLDVFVEMKK
ncbi:MAG: endonuclease [Bacteroidales bacterium]|nr:endonuclease [Bacteroidales bacterium]